MADTNFDSVAVVTNPVNPLQVATKQYVDAHGGVIQIAELTLINAQIKALPTTAIQIVAPPLISQLLIPFQVVYYSNLVAGYTNIPTDATGTAFIDVVSGVADDNSPMIAVWHAVSGGAVQASALNNLLSTGKNYTVALPITFRGLNAGNPNHYVPVGGGGEGEGLFIFMDNQARGDLTGGDAANKIKVVVFYYILDTI